MTPTVLPPDASGTPITEPNAPLGMSRRAADEVVVVGDRERRPGPEDLAGEALVDRHPLADEVDEDAAAVADHQARLVGFGEVDVAVRGPEQRRGVGQDRLEQDRRVVPVEEREGGLVERAQVRIRG